MCEENDYEPVFVSANTLNEVIDLIRICSIVLLGCTEDSRNELKEKLNTVITCLNEDVDEI